MILVKWLCLFVAIAGLILVMGVFVSLESPMSWESADRFLVVFWSAAIATLAAALDALEESRP